MSDSAKRTRALGIATTVIVMIGLGLRWYSRTAKDTPVVLHFQSEPSACSTPECVGVIARKSADAASDAGHPADAERLERIAAALEAGDCDRATAISLPEESAFGALAQALENVCILHRDRTDAAKLSSVGAVDEVDLDVMLPPATVASIAAQAKRLERTESWCVERAWKIAGSDSTEVDARAASGGVSQRFFLRSATAREIRAASERLHVSPDEIVARAWANAEKRIAKLDAGSED
jgi:hypothetical protein